MKKRALRPRGAVLFSLTNIALQLPAAMQFSSCSVAENPQNRYCVAAFGCDAIVFLLL
jgi:hypothetical protein